MSVLTHYYFPTFVKHILKRFKKGVTITTPGYTGPHWARTRPELTDYFNSTTVTSRIKA